MYRCVQIRTRSTLEVSIPSCKTQSEISYNKPFLSCVSQYSNMRSNFNRTRVSPFIFNLVVKTNISDTCRSNRSKGEHPLSGVVGIEYLMRCTCVVVHECPPVSLPKLHSNGHQAWQGLVTDAMPFHFRLNALQMAAPRATISIPPSNGVSACPTPPKISIKEVHAVPWGLLFGWP